MNKNCKYIHLIFGDLGPFDQDDFRGKCPGSPRLDLSLRAPFLRIVSDSKIPKRAACAIRCAYIK